VYLQQIKIIAEQFEKLFMHSALHDTSRLSYKFSLKKMSSKCCTTSPLLI